MKTYFVRTKIDQTLVGIFCAASPRALAKIIEDMVEPADCEYLVLKVNEGLFVEAQFVHAPPQDPNKSETIFLSNVPDEILGQDAVGAEEADASLEGLAAPGSPLDRAMREVIPPVLEPTEALMGRLQTAESGVWVSLTTAGVKPTPATAPRSQAPILILNPDGRIH